jgi:hypothetical protein
MDENPYQSPQLGPLPAESGRCYSIATKCAFAVVVAVQVWLLGGFALFLLLLQSSKSRPVDLESAHFVLDILSQTAPAAALLGGVAAVLAGTLAIRDGRRYRRVQERNGGS